MPHVARGQVFTMEDNSEQQDPGKNAPTGLRISSASEHEFPKIISFDSLARCGDEIWIENGGQIYRLRRTRQGKLILTK